MSMNERIFKIDQLLHDRRSVSFQELQNKLEVSAATLKRDIAYMRDRLHAPIVYDRESRGYRFADNLDQQYQLPGLWFTAEEIYAMLTMNQLLTNLDEGGIIGPHIKPLQARLSAIMDSLDSSAEDIKKRIRIERMGARQVQLAHFQAIGNALLKRKRLNIEYSARSTEQTLWREISPQRMVYYRDNWYLDAWCHMRKDLRSFSIDMIKNVERLATPADEMQEQEIDKKTMAVYGIFAGEQVQWAVLHFTPERAKWITNERWHPQQTGQSLPDGGYQLSVPYSDPRELMMDILKYGAEVRVMAPQSLVEFVQEEIRNLMKLY